MRVPGATATRPRTDLRASGLASVDAVAALLLAGGLVTVSFVTNSKSLVANLGPNTWLELALIVCGCGLGLAVLLWGAAGPAWGAWALALFAAVAALTAASVAWSVAPDVSWMEAGRTASYLAAFGGALALARIFPQRWPALVWAIVLLAVVLSGWAMLVKVFPAALDRDNTIGRLMAPFQYWNATGLAAALGLPACLWAGSRRTGARALRALTIPAVALLVAVVALSYSRSAILAAVLGVGVWFAAVPTRLRGAAVLALGSAGAGVICAWALNAIAFTQDGVGLSTRVHQGHTFGVVLALVLLATLPAGYGAVRQLDARRLTAPERQRLGRILVGLLALFPLAGVAALAGSSRGLTGEVSHIWASLTSTHQYDSDRPGRVIDLANSRPQYWREGITVGSHALLHGVGAGGFQFAQTRYTDDTAFAANAHGYAIQTFADFGLIGIALNLALLVAWCRAASVTLGRGRGPRQDRARELPAGSINGRSEDERAGELGPDSTNWSSQGERAGMVTLLAVAVAFGASSSIDWTWFIPGVTLPALLCAGWLAGRGPLHQRVGVRQASPRQAGPASAAKRLAATAVVALTVLAAWLVWQPLRSVQDANAALNALAQGNATSALSDAQAAASEDPVAWRPLFDLSLIYSALRDRHRARAELLDGVARQPDNAQAWSALGTFELSYGPLRPAVSSLQRAHELDLADTTTISQLAQAGAKLAQPRAKLKR